jgi:hydroxyacylglutathione hydrolase
MIRETFPVGPLQCNCTILGDESTREAIVIDPGENIDYILSRLQLHHLVAKQILVTHAHIDHVGGAVRLKRATGAPILLNELDIPLLKIMSLQAGWFGLVTPEVAPPDVSLEDGMGVGLGGRVIHTPGHTEGSVCLHFPAESLLLAGDTLFAGSIGRTDLPGGDSRKILESLHDKLMILPGLTKVISGHGGETTIAAEMRNNPFLR